MNEEQKDIAPLGFYNFRNHKKKFGIKLDDRRRHVYVVGKTGVGKTTLMENMVVADMKAGRGVGVVDPHGEFAEKMLYFVPEERLDDVIYFNPADMEYPIGFNPMEQVGVEFRHLVASGLMGVFKKIWPDVWSARMEYILNNTLLALLEYPGSSLLGIMRMLSEPAYRKEIVQNLQDPVIKAFWVNEFAKYTQRLETEAVAAIQNKVGQFVSNPLVRNILGQKHSSINMREIMDKKKIFIVNLSKGRIGEDNARLLGAMIITRLQLAAMSRVDIPEDKRADFFLYVDEFQNFATESFANILSEARKYRLSLILAHQYIGQLIDGPNHKVRDAVFGNVGTIICFRTGGEDAEFLEKEFMPEFVQNDLVNLAKANVYLKLMIDGVASRPFSAETIGPPKMPVGSFEDVIIKNSRERYGTPRKIVDEKISGEWESASQSIVGEKISRRDERPMGDMLRPREERFPRPEGRGSPYQAAPMAAREPQSYRDNRPAPSQQQPQFSNDLPIRQTGLPAGRQGGNGRQPQFPNVRPSESRPMPPSEPRPMPQRERPYPPQFANDRPPVREERRAPVGTGQEQPSFDRSSSTGRPHSPQMSPREDRPHPPQMPPMPPRDKPRQFPKQDINVDELRKAISESLNKNEEKKRDDLGPRP